jgi:peptidoglycan/xylan/chitin deacetylase (PgdA/CDA1 family)
MNLVSFSVKTKGAANFGRRLWTVFARFGFSEERSRRCLESILEALRAYGSAPTFYIPAVVLKRHPGLLAEIARAGAEIGIHGYVHNDYRTLDREAQLAQVRRAMGVFADAAIPFEGFRNPYLGWTEESVEVFTTLGLTYDSNEAVAHDVLDPAALTPLQRDGLEKSLVLFQAISCGEYPLRPHFEGPLVRIPTSIPDDEMLFDRLRLDAATIGRLWSEVMRRVYAHGGVYVLNLHPERGILCRPALDALLATASTQELPVWIARCREIAAWWKERAAFRLRLAPIAPGRWRIEAACSERATILARRVRLIEGHTEDWVGQDVRFLTSGGVVEAERCPCIALSPRTHPSVVAFLDEQGYPHVQARQSEASGYALYLDLPEGLDAGATRAAGREARSALLDQITALDAPLVYFGAWPEGHRAALSITGDIDSLTIQDFFLRVVEVADAPSPIAPVAEREPAGTAAN